jgi:hypothetical protein
MLWQRSRSDAEVRVVRGGGLQSTSSTPFDVEPCPRIADVCEYHLILAMELIFIVKRARDRDDLIMSLGW